MRINYKLFRGSTDRNLSVTYVYRFEESGDFQTVKERENGTITILPSFGINISNGFGKDSVYITSGMYYSFTSLLEKCVKLVSDHLYEIFPNVEGLEFEIDSKTLERFQTEKALSTNGMTFIPCVYVDETNQCFPGIQINTLKFGSVKIPFQDAIPMSKMLSSIDPHLVGLSILRILGKIE